ncbi:hypothetical protein ABE073_04295 [Lederbergia citrisecunda]|uniref:hypothetical protein n=1 Tax=Lederbergia citrisecunda TaxID=2833583 RepID=UPI003D293EE4
MEKSFIKVLKRSMKHPLERLMLWVATETKISVGITINVKRSRLKKELTRLISEYQKEGYSERETIRDIHRQIATYEGLKVNNVPELVGKYWSRDEEKCL